MLSITCTWIPKGALLTYLDDGYFLVEMVGCEGKVYVDD
jgi:hypothetical protein